MKNKNTKKLKYLIMFCIIILVVLLIITIILKNMNETQPSLSDEQIQLDLQNQQEENFKTIEESVVISKLADMQERDRMEYYFSVFIRAIEDKNYKVAYDMLYSEFKTNYFAQLSDFEEYVKKTFPKMFVVEHSNIERNGNVYVLFVTISDMLGSKDKSKEMKFVIKEESINNFVMSFSVI